MEVRVGVRAGVERKNQKDKRRGRGKDVWKGVYAPGSVVELMVAEERRARVEKLRRAMDSHGGSHMWDAEGWRSEVFNV
ncbi:hypothetical protein BDZ91DRAFT_739813 [Kalaharituber pfeilii]|nr:hypothetical protein BDZ91DRAFT_739813 [Kalaharituber pfeilii]